MTNKNITFSALFHNNDLNIQDLDDIFENVINQIVDYGTETRNIDTGENHTPVSVYEHLVFRLFYNMLIKTNSPKTIAQIVDSYWEVSLDAYEDWKIKKKKEKTHA